MKQHMEREDLIYKHYGALKAPFFAIYIKNVLILANKNFKEVTE